MDNLYGNIGKKIKGFAFVSCIIEALGAIVTGIIFSFIGIFDGEVEFILYGLLLTYLGPISAWVASWFLYAFGELVEKTVFNEIHNAEILDHMKLTDVRNVNHANNPTQHNAYKPYAPNPNLNTYQNYQYSQQQQSNDSMYQPPRNMNTNESVNANENPTTAPKTIEYPMGTADKEAPKSIIRTTYKTTEKNTKICDVCNFEQSGYRLTCWKCGAEFVDFGTFDDLK
jgi:hypothetical protein